MAEEAPVRNHLSTQLVSKGPYKSGEKPHRPPSGIRQAARDLGINREDARRAVKVASLSLDAKAAAKAHKLDNNRDALLAAAKYRKPAKQVEAIKQIATTPKDHDAAAGCCASSRATRKFSPQRIDAARRRMLRGRN